MRTRPLRLLDFPFHVCCVALSLSVRVRVRVRVRVLIKARLIHLPGSTPSLDFI